MIVGHVPRDLPTFQNAASASVTTGELLTSSVCPMIKELVSVRKTLPDPFVGNVLPVFTHFQIVSHVNVPLSLVL